MKDRIKQIRKSAGLTQEEFGKRIGATRAMVTTYELGKVDPPEPTALLICKEFNVSYNWLKSGTAPMYIPKANRVLQNLHGIMNGDNEFAKKVLTELSEYPKEAWEQLEAFVDRLSAKK